MKIIENETGRFFVDESGRLESYEHTIRNDMQDFRYVVALNIPESVQEIPSNLFCGYVINYALILPASLKQVGKFVFSGGHIDKVLLPEKPDSEMMRQLAHSLRFVHTWDSKKLVQDLPRECIEIYHGKGEPQENWRQIHNSCGTFFIDSDGVLMDYLPEQYNVFSDKSGVTVLNLLHIPEGVKAIPGEMFKEHKVLQEITFPKSLKCIGVGAGEGNAFNWSNLPDVMFPENLETLGDYAFAHSCFRSVTITGVSKYWNVGIRRAFKDSVVGTIRVSVKFREVLDEACKGWEWSEGFEITDPILGQLYCVKCLREDLRRGDTVLRVLDGIVALQR